MKRSELQRNIRQVVEQIVALAHPSRIVLFGSAVGGQVGPDSDLDFLVVVSERQQPDEVTDRLNIRVRRRPMPCDFVVVTPSVLRKHRNTPGFIYGEALDYGQDVYVG